ncbi:MAG: hypothetical protein ACRDB1_09590 [Microcoleaceae cyanobacterium]
MAQSVFSLGEIFCRVSEVAICDQLILFFHIREKFMLGLSA